jgi:hypothetical protein
MPIYKASMEEARCGGVFPGDASPVLMIRVKCTLFTLFTAWLVRLIAYN